MKLITAFVFLVHICFVIHIPSVFAYDVIFNAKALVYHTPSCEWARKCTRSCIKIDHILAQSKGGVPCKVCGKVMGKIDSSEAERKRLKDEVARLVKSADDLGTLK